MRYWLTLIGSGRVATERLLAGLQVVGVSGRTCGIFRGESTVAHMVPSKPCPVPTDVT